MEERRYPTRYGEMQLTTPTQAELRSIICDGDARLLTAVAERIGTELAKSMTTSQIRSIFGVVRQIQLNWSGSEAHPERRKQAMRQLILLKPRMAYQGARHGGGVQHLAKLLSAAIDLIQDDFNRFQHFADFFEAILAYHAAAGGR